MATVAYERGHDVSETDYGYGDGHNTDYGYGDQTMDYGYDSQIINSDEGYGDNNADYGYAAQTDFAFGDSQPSSSYGESQPSNADYGYGDSAPSNTDYGYGDSPPGNTDYGYGDSEPAESVKEEPKTRRPRRRCSVTKYSLEETAEDGSAEAEMVKNLHAAEMLQKFRQGL